MALEDIKIGKTIEEIQEGDSLTVTEVIELKDILLYLGLTNDNNPLYLQYDYTQATRYKKPVVPPVLLMGILTSNVSKHLPGPGSNVVDLSLDILEPIHHNSTITFEFEIKRVDERREQVMIMVEGSSLSGERLLEAELIVETPEKLINVDNENK
ncbi:MaoC family dehydratase [Jeotgalibaca ciconiae]|uniref:Enoyl-CoA hydratase n=1 Tax=Jeotgalibaca ciconiae TaxID=2496265 RepID=A0A3Q9BL87_9LACT|nr:MaoC/PaaZ C-terminal domain-containing protein [Jeotgalibaca ciconiae]AZP05025.1 enoyl-CoA hydratase [Jeotgalibaca ciconiae]HJB24497.1 MaoC family dehydratase N-terminal domain-containing protein [Candidatus Jeotgalibaca pullicola]